MTDRAEYTPGSANLAHVEKEQLQDGHEKWTLVVAKELRHPPEKVWEALTDPAHLREWAPFDANGNLGVAGAMVKLTTVGAPGPLVTETTVTRAESPELLEYTWGGFNLRWKLEGAGGGTRLTLWINISQRFMDRHLTGQPIGRIAGPKAMNFEGWRRLNAEYARQFGMEMPNWPPRNT